MQPWDREQNSSLLLKSLILLLQTHSVLANTSFAASTSTSSNTPSSISAPAPTDAPNNTGLYIPLGVIIPLFCIMSICFCIHDRGCNILGEKLIRLGVRLCFFRPCNRLHVENPQAEVIEAVQPTDDASSSSSTSYSLYLSSSASSSSSASFLGQDEEDNIQTMNLCNQQRWKLITTRIQALKTNLSKLSADFEESLTRSQLQKIKYVKKRLKEIVPSPAFYDKTTLEIMNYPASTDDNHSYEQDILKIMKESNLNTPHDQDKKVENIIPNFNLNKVIHGFLNRSEYLIQTLEEKFQAIQDSLANTSKFATSLTLASS